MNWTALLPLVGVVVGSGLTLVGQALTDRRALRRDEIAAQRQADTQRRTEWLLLQRQTITELQQHIEVLILLESDRPGPIRESIAEQGANAITSIHSRLARLQDRQLAADVAAWLHSSGSHDEREAEMVRLQERLGERLRETHV